MILLNVSVSLFVFVAFGSFASESFCVAGKIESNIGLNESKNVPNIIESFVVNQKCLCLLKAYFEDKDRLDDS